MPFATAGMGLEDIMLHEISQTEGAKNHMTSLILWDIKLKAANEQRRKIKTHRHIAKLIIHRGGQK